MSCPYFLADCPPEALPAAAASCTACGRFVKHCPRCGTRQRAFANFCRECSTELPEAAGNWLGAKGGSRRLGLNGTLSPDAGLPPWERLEIREAALSPRLGDSCRSLLGYDGHLIAVSQAGAIEIGDPRLTVPPLRLKADGPISCEPCVDRGVLYLGSPGRVTAYSLGALSLTPPRLGPLWQLPVAGTPVHALTAVDGRLYVTTHRQEGRQSRKDVQVIDARSRLPPGAPRTLFTGSRVSWMAADPARRQIVFLSEESGRRLHLHSLVHSAGRELDCRPLPWRPLVDQVPIAILNGKVFCVLGDEEALVRIDVDTATLELDFDIDTKLFSLHREAERDWDGDGVRVTTSGIVFLRQGIAETLAPLDRVVKGSPVLVGRAAAAIAMQDGRLRIYDLTHPPRHEVRSVAPDGEPLTALSSFDRYIAAGDAKGVVKVFELREKGTGA